jgi:hypothetical protein
MNPIDQFRAPLSMYKRLNDRDSVRFIPIQEGNLGIDRQRLSIYKGRYGWAGILSLYKRIGKNMDLSIYKRVKQYLIYIPSSRGELGMILCSSCSMYIYIQEGIARD